MEMRQELARNYDTGGRSWEPSKHQHLLECLTRGVCYQFFSPLEVRISVFLAAGQHFTFSLV